ncbi:MAG: hypothetical protein HYT36_02340 [Candidatus Staskawiczbacteria bacterium]|nr:hypothetical protein [Candidatus Staskawiczbacteria bacterium]
MSLFEKKPEIPRRQFKNFLKSTEIKSEGQRQLKPRERKKLEVKYFPRKYHSTISKGEYQRSLHSLKEQKRLEQDFQKKTKMQREIKYLEELQKRDFPVK